MKAKELHEFMREIGSWVNWEYTVDQFLAGEPDKDVQGIAVSWMATFSNLKKAYDFGSNLFVTHEPLFSVTINEEGKAVEGPLFNDWHLYEFLPGLRTITYTKNDPWVRKAEWLEENGMIVYRCHDFWDDFPEIGIHGAWADWIGLNSEPIVTKKFYEVHEVDNTKVIELAKRIIRHVNPLGQDVVHVIGDVDREVSKIAVGTGAITDYREMQEMGADVLLVTDDGTRLWESGQWSLDSGVPLIVVNHSTSEEPGMRTLAKYIQEKFPEIPVKQIPVGCIYKSIKI